MMLPFHCQQGKQAGLNHFVLEGAFQCHLPRPVEPDQIGLASRLEGEALPCLWMTMCRIEAASSRASFGNRWGEIRSLQCFSALLQPRNTSRRAYQRSNLASHARGSRTKLFEMMERPSHLALARRLARTCPVETQPCNRKSSGTRTKFETCGTVWMS